MAKDKLVCGRPAASGTLVHYAIAGETVWPAQPDAVGKHYARCDKQRIIVPSDELGPVDVTCTKCQRYADHRDLMEKLHPAKPVRPDTPSPEEVQEVPDSGDTTDAEVPEPEVDAANQEPEPPEKDTANQDAENFTVDVAQPAANLDGAGDRELGLNDTGKKRVTEENYKEFMKSVEQKTDGILPKFISKTGPKRKIYIVHTPTNTTVFNNVNPKVLSTALKYLNNVKVEWTNASTPCPKDFLEKINAAFMAACGSLGIKNDLVDATPDAGEPKLDDQIQDILKKMSPTCKKGSTVTVVNVKYIFDGENWEPMIIPRKRRIKRRVLPETSEPKKRTIKRRAKKQDKPKTERAIKRRNTKQDKPKTERAIKRRNKPNTDDFGFNTGTIRSYVTGLMEKGDSLKNLAAKISSKYNIPESRAKTKIKGLMRQYRKKGISVVIVTMRNPDDDFYTVQK